MEIQRNEKPKITSKEENDERTGNFMDHSFKKDLEMLLPNLPFRTNFFICDTESRHSGKDPVVLDIFNEPRDSDIYSISYIGERGNMFDGRLFICALEMLRDKLGEEKEIAERDLMIAMGIDPHNMRAREAVYNSFIKMSRTVMEIEYENTIGTTLLLGRASRYKLKCPGKKVVYSCSIPESFGFLLDRHYSRMGIEKMLSVSNSPIETRLSLFIHSNNLDECDPFLKKEQLTKMINPYTTNPTKLLQNIRHRVLPSLKEKGIIKSWGPRLGNEDTIEFHT